MFRAAVRQHLFWALGLVFLLAGCFPSPESNIDEERDPHYQEGRRKAESQDFKGAIEDFEKALEVNPRNASAHFELGVLYENQEDFATAIYHYQTHLKLRPGSGYGERAQDQIKACKGRLAASEFLGPTTQMMQRQLDHLTLDNKLLREQIADLRAQLAARQAPPPRTDPAPPPTPSNPSSSAPVIGGSPMIIRTSPPPRLAQNATLAAGLTNLKASDPQTPTNPAVATQQTTVYVVASGDTLGGIARRYKVKLEKLQAANPGIGADARRLRVGQKLTIPPP